LLTASGGAGARLKHLAEAETAPLVLGLLDEVAFGFEVYARALYHANAQATFGRLGAFSLNNKEGFVEWR